MQYQIINNKFSPIKLSKIILGTANYGTTIPDATAHRMLDAYVAAGGNCLDTARVYASWIPGGMGESERCIARWLKASGKRNQVILSTKGAHPPVADMSKSRMTPAEITADLHESLHDLCVESIDLYWLHRDDKSKPVGEIMELLHTFVKSGKVRSIGCSNWSCSRIQEANEYALQHGLTPFCASQILWSLADLASDANSDKTLVTMDDQAYDWYEQNDFPVFAFTSQARGFFARAVEQGLTEGIRAAYKDYITPENSARVERVAHYAKQSLQSPNAVALGYLINNQVPTFPIVGCKNEEQLEATLQASDIVLTQETVAYLRG